MRYPSTAGSPKGTTGDGHGAKQETKRQIIFSEELKFDKHLKLTNTESEMKKIIVEGMKESPVGIEISYPNDYVFVSLAIQVYDDKEFARKPDKRTYGRRFNEKLGNWQLLTVAYNNRKTSGYIGAAYWNPDMQQVIIAHRGTDPSEPSSLFGALLADVQSICLNQHTPQIDSAVTFTDKILAVLRDIHESDKNQPWIQLFFTGHSLGGWLAQITTFTAWYVERHGDYFLRNATPEKTGYHASTLAVDSPGASSMLGRIQRELMDRYAPSVIESLDVTNYVSAPNVINTCNPQIGRVYRLDLIFSEQEKRLMQGSAVEYIWRMHKNEKFLEVFDPATGRVAVDEEGALRIKRVRDWPLLVEGDKGAAIRDKLVWFPKMAARLFLPGWMSLGLELAYDVYSNKKWYDEFYHELNLFFGSANASNHFHPVDDGSYRFIRHNVDPLDASYQNERSINVFTPFERQFLDTCQLLQKHQKDLPDEFQYKNLFSCLNRDQQFKNKTMNMLKEYKIESDILEVSHVISSPNLKFLIPHIKRMLYLFEEMQSEVEDAQQSLGVHILITFYQSASFAYQNSIENPLEFSNDALELRDFLNNESLQILDVVQSNTSLGAIRVFKTFKKVENCYYTNHEHHLFFSLKSISYLGDTLFVGFLKKIEANFLLVVECDDVIYDKNMADNFLRRLFKVLEKKSNIKIVFVRDRDGEISNLVSDSIASTQSKHREYHIDVKFNDLSSDSQNAILRKMIIFQGRGVPLGAVLDSTRLDTLIDSETIISLFKNIKIEIGKTLPDLVEMENFFIGRHVIKKVKLRKDFVQEDLPNDLFAISNVNQSDLSSLATGKRVRNFETNDPDKSKPIRFIVLRGENNEKQFEELCTEYSQYNIHWLRKNSNGDFIWKNSHGTLSELRRFIENYENDLPENDYSVENTSISIVDVDDVEKFEERFVIVAAEPGMGKSTALTRLGIKATNEARWIIRLNLAEYKDRLEHEDFNETDRIISFLSEDVNDSTISRKLTHKLLLDRFYNYGKIVLLLDGFDEITSEGQENVITLVKTLRSTKLEKLFVSTRLHLRDELENSLSAFAYVFKPFFQREQMQFLRKFWRKDLDPTIRDDSLDNYINALLEFLSHSIGDAQRKFMGIPLQMKMVAEVFIERLNQSLRSLQDLNERPTFPENFDVFELYSRFAVAKFRIYFEKIGGENINLNIASRRELLTANASELHGMLAFKEMFSKVEPEMMKALVGGRVWSENNKQEINLIGFAQIVNGRAQFVHRTFAEYFLAEYFSNSLHGKEENFQRYQATIKFLAKEFFESRNEVIKTFLDHRLASEQTHVAALEGNLNGIADFQRADALGRRALHLAAMAGHVETVAALLASGATLEADGLGKTVLHYAARYNKSADVVDILLNASSRDVNARDDNNRTAVFYAAEQGVWNIVDRILAEKKASVDDLDIKKLLFYYTFKNDAKKLKSLQRKGATVEGIDNRGNSLLHIAAQNQIGSLEMVQFLVENGVGVHIANNSGKGPISYAAENEHWDILVYLLRKYADFNALTVAQKVSLFNHSSSNAYWDILTIFMRDDRRDNYFNLLDVQQKVELLCHVIHTRYLDVAVFLIENGAEVNNCDKDNKKPIYYASQIKSWDIVNLLLRKNADLNGLSDTEKRIQLRYLAEHFHWDIFKLLMERGNINEYFGVLVNKEMYYCLFYIISVGSLGLTKKIMQELKKKFKIFDVNLTSTCGKTLLHIAAQNGQLNIVQFFVKKGANLNAATLRGSTPLHLAVQNNKLETVKYLTMRGADLEARDAAGKTPIDLATDKSYLNVVKYFEDTEATQKKLLEASKGGDIRVVEDLVNRVVNINVKDNQGNTPLHLAAGTNRWIAMYLIERGADVLIKNANGKTCKDVASEICYRYIHEAQKKRMLVAAAQGDLATIRSVVGQGVHVNCKCEFGNTPIHNAARYGHCTVVKYLIEQGAKFDALNENDITPKGFAVRGGHQDIVDVLDKVQLLFKDVISYNRLDCVKRTDDKFFNARCRLESGYTPLHLAVEKGCMDLMEACLQKGADVNAVADSGWTALHVAAYHGRTAAAQYLLGMGAAESLFVKARPKSFMDGCYPLHVAAQHGHLDVLKFLADYLGCGLEFGSEYGWTALHFAAYCDHLDVVEYLVQKGARVNAETKHGSSWDSPKKTPMALALDRGHTSIARFLCNKGASC